MRKHRHWLFSLSISENVGKKGTNKKLHWNDTTWKPDRTSLTVPCNSQRKLNNTVQNGKQQFANFASLDAVNLFFSHRYFAMEHLVDSLSVLLLLLFLITFRRGRNVCFFVCVFVSFLYSLKIQMLLSR